MTLFKLKSAPMVVLEDNCNNNTIPLLKELFPDNLCLNMFCYEQTFTVWQNVIPQKSIKFYKEVREDEFSEYNNQQCCVFIDSVNQMAITLGWYKCLKYIKKFQINENVKKLILVLHKDCLQLSSKIQKHLNHISNAFVSFSDSDLFKIVVQLKIGNKLLKSEEMLAYNTVTSELKCERIVKEVAKNDEQIVKPLPESLSTFKIEVDQTQKLEKYKLKLPYMSKIHEGQSKVYYEPDAVDDWDDEDPDDDLNI